MRVIHNILALLAICLPEAQAADTGTVQLEALAITDDQQAQEKVWDSLRHDWERIPNNLRSLLTQQHVSASDRRARFVGVDAYVAAGALSNAICSTKKMKDI